MTQLFDPGWWISFAGAVWPWWLACALLGLLALPLCVRIFHGLADAGAGLSIGVGIILTSWSAWVLAHPYSGRALVIRAFIALVGAALLLASRYRPREARGLQAVAAWFLTVGLVFLPHTRAGIAAAVLILAGLSAAAVLTAPDRCRAALHVGLVPFLVAQGLFAAGFLYFVNVRTYIPWATFDLALFQAEKAGNLMHLNGALRAVSMPPADPWFLGEPSNYYYAGHLMIATLAKLTGFPARIAFNLGLATIFALTLSMGFSLCYSMVVALPPALGRRFTWHRGMAWGLVGALAITVFGNLDAWRQLGRRSPEEARSRLESRLLAKAQRATSEAELALLRDEAVALRTRPLEDLRFSAENLKLVDFWKSSRAIHGAPRDVNDDGTITEFPYFSALLGDLHPHHMALPFTLAALAACLALLRRTLLDPPATEEGWLERALAPATAMAFAIGAVLPVNTWDTIVLSVLYLLVVARSRISVVGDGGVREWLPPAAALAFSWCAAFVVNWTSAVPALGSPIFYVAALAVAFGAPLAARRVPWLGEGDRAARGLAVGAALAALGGLLAGMGANAGFGRTLLAGARDALLFVLAVFVGRLAARAAGAATGWLRSLLAYGAVGAAGVVVAFPFLLGFRSPLSGHLLEKALPPIVQAQVRNGHEPIVQRIWSALPINPFPAVLRTELLDEFAHWGLFMVPLAAFLLIVAARAYRRERAAVGNVLGTVLAVGAAAVVGLDGYWAGAIVLTLAVLAVGLSAVRRLPAEDVPILLFAGAGFFWAWFVEALHFDDAYGGIPLERYNTPFKIFYPLWPMLGAAAVAALRRLTPRVRVASWPLIATLRAPGVLVMSLLAAMVGAWAFGVRPGLLLAGRLVAAAVVAASAVHTIRFAIHLARTRPAPATADAAQAASVPVEAPAVASSAESETPAPTVPAPKTLVARGASTDAPALAVALVACVLGFLYPFAATAVRTRSFFGEPLEGTWMDDPNGERTREFYTRRTLDSLAWLGQTKRYAADLPAIEWLNAHAPTGSVVLEAPGAGAYTPEGRVSSMTGLPTLVGWKHHENQWRGWDAPLPLTLQDRYFDELSGSLPSLPLPVRLPRPTELDLYRASLRQGGSALRATIAQHVPGLDAGTVEACARALVRLRQSTLNGTALTEKLAESMKEIYAAPELDAHVRHLLALHRIRYVFVGSLERTTYPAGLQKFEAFPRVYAGDGAAVYEVPSVAPAATPGT